ncbi:hypothetical protein [Nocardia transvalensis]|uniref:hypothetical protein n=1 Tax=Nocardia transvalensis TaxID=37333 RepID=UPI001893F5BD|nr:hypothetical protein [Nocardia transvalensis]MBF6330872.1 hypothetical protein [Nocardia transvalensis]
MTEPLAPRPDNAYDPETGTSKYGTGDVAKDIPNFGYDLSEATVSQFFDPWSGGTGGLIGAFDKVVKSLFDMAVTIAGQLVQGTLKEILTFVGNLLGVHGNTLGTHASTLGDHEARIENLKKSVDGVVQTINGAYQPLYFSGFVELKPTTNLIDVIMIGAGGGGGGGKDGGLISPNYGGGGGGGGGESHVTINASDVPSGPDGIRRIWITMGGNGTGEQPPQGGGPGVGGQNGADTTLYFSDPSQGTPTAKYRAGGGAGGQSRTNAASPAVGGSGTVSGGNGGAFRFHGQTAVSENGQDSAQPVGVSNGGGGGGAGSGMPGGIPVGTPDHVPGRGGGGGPNLGGKPVGGNGTATTEYLPIGGGGGAGGNSSTPGGNGGDPGGGGGGGGAIGGIGRQTAGGHGGVGRAWIRERT